MSASTFQQRLRRAEAALGGADRALSRVITRVGPSDLRLERDFEPFQALVSAICHQQLHGKAAQTILSRVKARFGDGAVVDVSRVKRARLDSLRACGLSQAKALAVKDLAHKRLDGTVPGAATLHRLSDDDIVTRVTQVRGIGRWTVEMMLMFRMGRLDVFPTDDFGVRKGFMLLRGLDAPVPAKALLPHGEAWRPYRSVASWYLWRVAEGQ